MKEISLTQGLITLVDDTDYDWLNQYKWFAMCDGQRYYAVRNIYIKEKQQRQLRMHRVILDAPKGIQVDHEDHNTLNNQRYNIRLATHRQNQCNSPKYSTYNGKPTSSKYKGVTWEKTTQKWRARVYFNGKDIYLGLFENEIEAALAYDKAAILHYGEFAKLNFRIEPPI